MLGATGIDHVEALFLSADDALSTVRSMQTVMGAAAGWELLQAALLYVATVLGLKRWLNLA